MLTAKQDNVNRESVEGVISLLKLRTGHEQSQLLELLSLDESYILYGNILRARTLCCKSEKNKRGQASPLVGVLSVQASFELNWNHHGKARAVWVVAGINRPFMCFENSTGNGESKPMLA